MPIKTLITATLLSIAVAAHAAPDPERQQSLQALYSRLAASLAAHCPITAPEDEVAFARCRKALYGDSMLRRQLPDILLWGRHRGQSIKDTPLTQFTPDVYAGLYAPLFMFEGTATVSFDKSEKLFKAVLPVRFRNRMAPGQFPYPFWHDTGKWSGYQSATALVFYLHPETDKIRVAQYRHDTPEDAVLTDAQVRAKSFDGAWLWTDAQGHTQPQVTLFDGLYSAENPYLGEIDAAYRSLALEMREGECNSCHVPDNPQNVKRLVLLQTPAHAAGEVKRILRAVREGSMPEDDFGIEKALPQAVKARLLERAETFDAVLTQARIWETRHHAD